MPYVPLDAPANILSNFKDSLVNWMNGDEVPRQGPHTNTIEEYGCTIKEDFQVNDARAFFKKGMQGHWIEQRSDGWVKIFIRGITERPQDGIWVENLWVPGKYVEKGKRWKSNINDWDFTMDLTRWKVGDEVSGSKAMASDTRILSKTITRLIEEFDTNPAAFMGTKIQDLLEKRRTQGKGNSIDSVTRTIIKGIRDANLYQTFNKPDFTLSDIDRASSFHINRRSPSGTGGIYLRSHVSSPTVTRWQPNTKYVYVGKTMDFKERYVTHLTSMTAYGDLTRNSNISSFALCIMSESDIIDFAYLVEQIFVCLFESYKSSLPVGLNSTIDAVNSIEHVEAIQAAFYFRAVSAKVFRETGFPGAVNRSSFGVSKGANYSMPFKEWAVKMEQLLFLRSDMIIKSRDTGEVMPISVFRRAKMKTANYTAKKKQGTPEAYEEMYAFQKYHLGRHFFSVRHSQKVTDGTMGPRQDDPYQFVFEVRTDGKPHPNAWSRLYSVGPFKNWDEGRSLAVRMEWQHPPNSGQWKHRYLYCHKVYTFQNRDQAGSHVNYIKTIAMVRWLFNSVPNEPSPWMPRLRGCAYVLQTDYNYHTQTIKVKQQDLFNMRSGATKPRAEIVNAMKALGLENVDGSFGLQPKCDTCTMLDIRALTVTLGQTVFKFQARIAVGIAGSMVGHAAAGRRIQLLEERDTLQRGRYQAQRVM